MFYIDDFNRDDNLSLEEAVKLLNGFRQGSLLENMEYVKKILVERMHEDEFCDDWCYEINAYNKVYEEMNKLFEVA